MYDGLLLIDKQPDCTSHDVVQGVRRLLKQRKVGHCGTLDPGATGLLVATVGRATRLTRFFIRAPKVYEGVIQFGVATDTYDRFGTVTSEAPVADLYAADLAVAIDRFVGTYTQPAPPFSAKKFKGVKYYEMARRGEEVPEARKEITVFEFTGTGPIEDGRLCFRLSCSSGTYVRTLAHDLGQALGCGGHLADLRRLQVGPFKIHQAVRLEQLQQQLEGDGELQQGWLSFDDIPLPFAEVAADERQEQRISHGQTVMFRQLDCSEGDWVKLVNRRRQLIAVGTVTERIGHSRVGIVQPRIVFA
ncbi:MAG: tRNA pseudouridine(55) synthase TruB [Thermoanaerobaculia bacterium]